MASTDGPVSATTTSDTLGFSTPVFAEAKSDGGPVNLLQSKSQSQSTQTAAAAASASAATTAAAQQMQYITLASTGTAKSQAEAKSSSSSRSPHDHKHDVLGSNFADVQYKDTIRCPAANVEEVRSDNFIDALAGQPTVVMFYGPECVHTNSFTPVYECVAAALPSIKFIKMSSTESISRKYAKATPTVRFFNGKPKYEQDLGLIYKGNPEIPALKHFCKSSAGRYGHDVVIKSSDETQVNLDGGQTHHVLGREHTTREGIDSVTTTITPSLSSSVGSDLHHHGAHHHRHLHSNGEALTREDYVEDAYDHAHAHGHSHHGHHNTVRISDAEEDMMLDTHSLMETGESMTALLRGMAPSCTCDLE